MLIHTVKCERNHQHIENVVSAVLHLHHITATAAEWEEMCGSECVCLREIPESSPHHAAFTTLMAGSELLQSQRHRISVNSCRTAALQGGFLSIQSPGARFTVSGRRNK